MNKLPDIKPSTPVSSLDSSKYKELDHEFCVRNVSIATGMSSTFIAKVCGRKKYLSVMDVLSLLEQDCFKETLVPRSRVLDYLISENAKDNIRNTDLENISLIQGNAIEKLSSLPKNSIQCVVTSTPYWGLRIYKDPYFVTWADGETCPFGHEQTPEGFVRHTTEVLANLYDVLSETGSIWWNIMDTFNTRTQIRSNASEALKAMQGKIIN